MLVYSSCFPRAAKRLALLDGLASRLAGTEDAELKYWVHGAESSWPMSWPQGERPFHCKCVRTTLNSSMTVVVDSGTGPTGLYTLAGPCCFSLLLMLSGHERRRRARLAWRLVDGGPLRAPRWRYRAASKQLSVNIEQRRPPRSSLEIVSDESLPAVVVVVR